LTEYCHIGNFGSCINCKIIKLKNYSANFDENCIIYSKELVVSIINGIINSDKFGRSNDDLYLGVSFWDASVFSVVRCLSATSLLHVYINFLCAICYLIACKVL